MTDEDSATRTVRWKRGPGEIRATYETVGRFLILTTPYGVRRTALGLQQPRKLAYRFLRNLCAKAAAAAEVAVPDAAPAVAEAGAGHAVAPTARNVSS